MLALRRPLRSAAALLAALLLATAPAAAQDEAVVLVPTLWNGDLAEAPRAGADLPPWWREVVGLPAGGVRAEGEDGPALVTALGADGVPQALGQPLAAYAPLAGGVVVRGEVHGLGVVRVTDARLAADGGPRTWDTRVGTVGEWTPFELRLGDLVEEGGPPPVPRLAVAFAADPAGAPGAETAWRDLAALAPMPCPDEAALRAEVLALLRHHFGLWLERSLDETGTPHALVVQPYDAVTGERLGAPAAGLDLVLFADLLRAWRAEPDEAWRTHLEAWAADWLVACFHPDTGLPRRFDPAADAPLDDTYVEPHLALDVLVELAEHGPEAARAPAREAAARAYETLLASGVLPDGNVAAVYRPRDAAASTSVPEIRHLNTAAQLARLGALLGDARGAEVAREAVLTLDYSHHWPGTWDGIDPGFDDTYGTVATAASKMWAANRAWAAPVDEEAFRGIVEGGFDHYAPLWRDAVRHGGSVAADQVRCWHLARRVAELQPERSQEAGELLLLAARSHFRGQQVEGGLWIDVTIVDFDPKANLGVGDVVGLPQNLLEGLGAIYEQDLGLRTPELRALFTAVLRSTVEAYGEPYGLRGSLQRGTTVPAEGSLRLAAALVEMLERLPR